MVECRRTRSRWRALAPVAAVARCAVVSPCVTNSVRGEETADRLKTRPTTETMREGETWDTRRLPVLLPDAVVVVVLLCVAVFLFQAVWLLPTGAASVAGSGVGAGRERRMFGMWVDTALRGGTRAFLGRELRRRTTRAEAGRARPRCCWWWCCWCCLMRDRSGRGLEFGAAVGERRLGSRYVDDSGTTERDAGSVSSVTGADTLPCCLLGLAAVATLGSGWAWLWGCCRNTVPVTCSCIGRDAAWDCCEVAVDSISVRDKEVVWFAGTLYNAAGGDCGADDVAAIAPRPPSPPPLSEAAPFVPTPVWSTPLVGGAPATVLCRGSCVGDGGPWAAGLCLWRGWSRALLIGGG